MIVGGIVEDPGFEGYAYDLFVSYRRKGNVGGWVQNHFVKVLDQCLADHMPAEPRIFLDVVQEPSTHWRRNLPRALGRSRLLVAVWSPSYFTSEYCMAEWQTMVRREQVCGFESREDQRGLVHPIRYSDGESFPEDAKGVQYEEDFEDLRFPYPQFEHSLDYLLFHRAVDRMAVRLASRLTDVPEWDSDWPVEWPDAVPADTSRLPRL